MNDFYSSDLPDFFCKPENYHLKSNLHSDYPINHAAFFGDLERVKELIKLGVDLDSRGDLEYTALHHAAYRGHFDIVKVLVESGSDIHLKTELGKNAIELASLMNNKDIYHWLVNYHKPEVIADANKLLRYYSERYFYGDDIGLESTTECGEYPIHIAVKRGKLDEVKSLISAGVNLDVTTDDGFEFSPLHYAIGRKYFEIIKLLLNNNIDFELKSGMGYSAMDLAMLIGDKKIIFYLYSFIKNGKVK